MKLRNAAVLAPVFALSTLIFTRSVFANVSSYTASSFSQFCAHNPGICKKVDVNGTKAGLKCPDFNNQLASKVYVHAGDGQTVYEMPHSGFDYVTNLYGVGGAEVEVTTHQHNLSWVGIVCDPKNTPTQTPTLTATLTPTVTPSVTATVTPTGEVSPTTTSTPAPTDGGNNNNNNSSSGSNDSGRGGAEVLGATTLAFTGSVNREGEMVIFFGGLSVLLQGIKMYLKK